MKVILYMTTTLGGFTLGKQYRRGEKRLQSGQKQFQLLY